MDSKKEQEHTSSKSTSHTPPYETKQRIWSLLRSLSLPLAFSIIYPLALYYGLRAINVNAFMALLIGALPIVGFQLYQLIKKGKIDLLGMLMLFILGLSVAIAFITGSARFMLAKAGFFTAIIGLGFLVSLFLKRPVVYTIAAYLLERMKISKEHLESLWVGVPKFRRVWRISTVIWGAGILLNAAIILLMAYLMPIDTVPALNAVVNLVIFVVLQIATNVYYRKQGIWKLVFHSGIVQRKG